MSILLLLAAILGGLILLGVFFAAAFAGAMFGAIAGLTAGAVD